MNDFKNVFGQINPPAEVKNLTNKGGGAGISYFLGVMVELIFVLATVVVVVMIIIAAIQLITSGGDKETVSKARSRITYAIIGITLLATTFVMLRIIGQVLNITFFAY